MTSPSRPPRLAERIVAMTCRNSAWRETTLGDLGEEHAGIFERRGCVRAWLWYWGQTLALLFSKIADVLRAALTALRTGDSPMRVLVTEVRFAVRTLARQPLMAVAVVATMALGLGANAAAFSMLNELVFRPFQFAGVDRLAMLSEYSPREPYPRESVAPANFLDWRRQADRFDRVVAYRWSDMNLAGSVEATRIHGYRVSGDFFDTLQVQPASGRLIGPGDDVEGGGRIVVLGDALWKRTFGGRTDLVGQAIRLDDTPYTVVGIAPPDFTFPEGAEFWAPLVMNAATAVVRNERYLTVLGRLRPGATFDDARAQMDVIGARLRQQYPVDNRDHLPRVQTMTLGMIDPGIPEILGMIQLGAVVVLLIGGANIVNLLLARGCDRQREIAVRLAIGGNRWQVIRQLLIESLVLASIAVPVALALAHVALEALKGTMPAQIVRYVPGWMNMGINLPVTGVALGGAALAAVMLGLFPALQASKPDLTGVLRDGGRTSTTGTSRQRVRRFVVVAEMALALPLLVAAALAASGGYRFAHGPQGYDPTGVAMMQLTLPGSYEVPERRRQFAERLIAESSRVPGVTAAAMASLTPSAQASASRPVEIDGQPVATPNDRPAINYRIVSSGYFDVMSIPVLRGREFGSQDRADGEPVAIVSQAMAEKFWPDQDAIGKRIRVGDDRDTPWLKIVGVTGDVIDDWFDRRNVPTVYVAMPQRPSYTVTVVARTSGDPRALMPGLRAALQTTDPNQPPTIITTLSQSLHDRTIGIQMIGAMMGILGTIALLLATVGVYSLMSYDVSRRRQEIGVRMALGATRGEIVRSTITQTGRLAAIGIVIGLVLAVIAGRGVESALFGAVALGVPLVAGITFALVFTALAACIIPARHAAKVDPATALQGQ